MSEILVSTQYLPPTDTEGSRIRVMIGTRSQVFPWDHELDPGDNHEHSARVMASKYGLVSDVRFMVEKPWRDGNVYFVSFEEMDGTSFLG